MLSRIDKYILKNFLGTFIFLLGAFSLIAIVIDFTEKINDFVDRKVPLVPILNYFKNFIPYILALLFPIFIFVAVIFFTSRLANRSEIIAILSSGMSFKRFMRPYVIGSAIISGVLLFANHFVIPIANKARLKFEEKYLWEHFYATDNNFHIRISPNEYIFMQSYNVDAKTGYRFSYEKLNKEDIVEKIVSDRCQFDSIKNIWKLIEVTTRKLNGIHEEMINYPTLEKAFPFSPSDLVEKREAKQMMTTPQILAFIHKEKQKGSQNLNEYLLEYYRRTAAPFSAFVLSIIGACIASRKVRGGSGIHLAVGLMISAAYIFIMQFSTMFSLKGNLHPMIAVWIPNVLFGVLAVFIYRKYSK